MLTIAPSNQRSLETTKNLFQEGKYLASGYFLQLFASLLEQLKVDFFCWKPLLALNNDKHSQTVTVGRDILRVEKIFGAWLVRNSDRQSLTNEHDLLVKLIFFHGRGLSPDVRRTSILNTHKWEFSVRYRHPQLPPHLTFTGYRQKQLPRGSWRETRTSLEGERNLGWKRYEWGLVDRIPEAWRRICFALWYHA